VNDLPRSPGNFSSLELIHICVSFRHVLYENSKYINEKKDVVMMVQSRRPPFFLLDRRPLWIRRDDKEGRKAFSGNFKYFLKEKVDLYNYCSL